MVFVVVIIGKKAAKTHTHTFNTRQHMDLSWPLESICGMCAWTACMVRPTTPLRPAVKRAGAAAGAPGERLLVEVPCVSGSSSGVYGKDASIGAPHRRVRFLCDGDLASRDLIASFQRDGAMQRAIVSGTSAILLYAPMFDVVFGTEAT